MDNPSSSGKPHGIAIEGNGVDKDGQIVAPGSKSTVTVTLKAGTYEYYCPIPAHKAAGMKGTLRQVSRAERRSRLQVQRRADRQRRPAVLVDERHADGRRATRSGEAARDR